MENVVVTDGLDQVNSSNLELAGHTVRRIGFGASRLTAGDGWGVPRNPEASHAVLRAALESGVNYVDTADALGPGVSESIIGDVIGNRDDVLVATKVGMLRPGPTVWDVLGHPNYLRQQVHNSLQRLRRDRLDLVYLHRIDPNYPLADQLGALQELRDAGLIGALGVSEPTLPQLEEVLRLERVAAVQSVYNVAATANAAIAERLAEEGIVFVAYWPLIGRGLPADLRARVFAVLAEFGVEVGLDAAQTGLAWILSGHANAAAIVGSRNTEHLRRNLDALGVELGEQLRERITAAVAAVLDGVTFHPRHSKDQNG